MDLEKWISKLNKYQFIQLNSLNWLASIIPGIISVKLSEFIASGPRYVCAMECSIAPPVVSSIPNYVTNKPIMQISENNEL